MGNQMSDTVVDQPNSTHHVVQDPDEARLLNPLSRHGCGRGQRQGRGDGHSQTHGRLAGLGEGRGTGEGGTGAATMDLEDDHPEEHRLGDVGDPDRASELGVESGVVASYPFRYGMPVQATHCTTMERVAEMNLAYAESAQRDIESDESKRRQQTRLILQSRQSFGGARDARCDVLTPKGNRRLRHFLHKQTLGGIDEHHHGEHADWEGNVQTAALVGVIRQYDGEKGARPGVGIVLKGGLDSVSG
ncbi:unnamed protein product, partial [Choristocarpus tenellus]